MGVEVLLDASQLLLLLAHYHLRLTTSITMSTTTSAPSVLATRGFNHALAHYETALKTLWRVLREECPTDENGRQTYVAGVVSLMVSTICVVVRSERLDSHRTRAT